MADPLTGLATVAAVSSILSVIDFASKVIFQATKLAKSTNNALEENIMIEQLVQENEVLAKHIVLDLDNKRPLKAAEQAVDRLAQECRCSAGELLGTLDELKIGQDVRGAKRALQSAKLASKALMKRSTIIRQRNHLEALQDRLSDSLLNILRSTQAAHLEAITDRIDTSTAKTALKIVESQNVIIQELQARGAAPDDKTLSIVDSLRFSDMRQRREAIPEAHKGTFSWIIQDSASPFPKWLRSKENMFWISGKAGSGKSTLMKYVSSHTFVKSLLVGWAGDKRLVIVDSYLWNPGSRMQRTEQGLLQSILYQILNSCHDLVEQATPDRWNEGPLFHRNPSEWSLAELRNAFENIFERKTTADDEQDIASERDSHVRSEESARRRREMETHFCFFIDGLDEYQGEQWRLVDTVKSLAKSPRIKICVSSRPWNIFRTAFSDLPSQLQLEQLTRGDITHYVQSGLSLVVQKYGREAETLISSIVSKAEGVFFWVYLVVRSLREGFEEGDSIPIMRQRLNEFPADLEEYFEHMLSRLGKVYRAQTSQALYLATLVIGQEQSALIHDSACFLSFWLLSQDLLAKPDFAFEKDFERLFTADLINMANRTRNFLNACCRDFLHIPSLEFPALVRSNPLRDVQFLHRTVYEFLTSEDMRHVLNQRVPAHFQDPTFPVHVALARIKLVPIDKPQLCEYFTDTTLTAISDPENAPIDTKTVAEFEKAALFYLNEMCDQECEMHHGTSSAAVMLCDCFESNGLHDYEDALKEL